MASLPIDAVLQAELAAKLSCADKHGTTIETYQSAMEIMIRVVSKEDFYCICWYVTRAPHSRSECSAHSNRVLCCRKQFGQSRKGSHAQVRPILQQPAQAHGLQGALDILSSPCTWHGFQRGKLAQVHEGQSARSITCEQHGTETHTCGAGTGQKRG